MLVPVNFSNFETTVRKVYLDQEQHVGVTLGPGSYLVNGNLEFGNIHGHVLIGRYCSLGHRLIFEVGLNHDYHQVTTYPFDDLLNREGEIRNRADAVNHNQIILGNDVWIGCDVTIMGGVHIGNGAVIGAGAVIAKDIPPYAVVVGNPARVIKYRFQDDIIEKLQKIKWWNWSEEKILNNLALMKDVRAFCDKFYRGMEESGMSCKLGDELAKLRRDGWNLYLFSADFTAKFPVWQSVVKQYLDHFTADDKVVLLLEVSPGDETTRALEEIQKQLTLRGENAPMISSFEQESEKVSLAVLAQVNGYITNREDRSSQYVDYASTYGVRIISGLDYHIALAGDRKKEVGNENGVQPLLTIGVPTYNRSKYLRTCLQALANSIGNDRRFEVMISDNASTDDSPTVIQEYVDRYANFVCIRQAENIGGAKNFLYLWKHAHGKYVMLCGDDDCFTKELLPYVGKVLDGPKEFALAALFQRNAPYYCEANKGINAYIQNVSYIATSITSIIMRKDIMDIDAFMDVLKEEALEASSLQQVALQMELLHKDDRFLCIYGKAFLPGSGEAIYITPEEYLRQGRSAGFGNLGKIFVGEYLDILHKYEKYGIRSKTIQEDKRVLLDRFLIPWCKNIATLQVRWCANGFMDIFERYYREEVYYDEAKSILQDILKDLPEGIKEPSNG